MLVGAHVNDELAFVGYDVVLRAAIDDGALHLRWSEEFRYLPELVVAYEDEVVERLVDGIDALVACCMSALSVCHAVDDHESSLCNGRLHACRFAYDGDDPALH